MRPIVYLFIFALLFLIFKAFFLDAYIAEHYSSDTNTSVESNATVPEPTPALEAEVKSQTPAENVSDIVPEKHEKQDTPESKKMPLDRLGDSLSKHIKL